MSHPLTASSGDSDRVAETDRREPSVEVPLEALCVIVETAQRFGIYQGTAVFDAYMQMPTEVNRRLIERANVHTENLLRGAQAVTAHREGKPHDESMCVECAISKAESNGP